MGNKIHIIMVTWNALEYTKIALDSLFKYTDLPYYLTIVDNGSSSETINYLTNLEPSKYCEDYQVLQNPENIGYGGAITQGYLTKNTQYVCVVNNDVVFSPNWLQGLIKAIKTDKKIGIVGPLRPVPWCKHPYSKLDTDKVLENLSNDLSPQRELFEFCNKTNYEEFVKDVLKENTFGVKFFSGPPIHIVTCCALMRSKILEKVGGIADLNLKFGTEDTDLSWRITSSGYKIAVTSYSYVHHFKHKSIKENKQQMQPIFNKYGKLFFDKWQKIIQTYLNNEIKKGIDVNALILDKDYYEYWVFRKLLQNVGHDKFWEGINITTK